MNLDEQPVRPSRKTVTIEIFDVDKGDPITYILQEIFVAVDDGWQLVTTKSKRERTIDHVPGKPC